MSKISEQKALGAYPDTTTYRLDIEDKNKKKREGYIQGYDQAYQDFLEKAEKWLEPTFKSIAGYNYGGDLMNDFKNYMQNEV